MYDVEREKMILKVLEEKKTIGVNTLAKLVYCSGSTIRRDLTRLEKNGLVVRHFGSVSLTTTTSIEESSFLARESVNLVEKKELTKKAAEFIKSNSTLFIDSSTTLYHIVPYLADKTNLLIITNGIKIANEIIERTNHRVYVIGGELMPHSNSTLGSRAISLLSDFHADLCLMSCGGFDYEFGVSEVNQDISEIKRAMIKNSTQRILLIDSTKPEVCKAFKTCDIDAISVIITTTMDEEQKKSIEEKGVSVIICK